CYPAPQTVSAMSRAVPSTRQEIAAVGKRGRLARPRQARRAQLRPVRAKQAVRTTGTTAPPVDGRRPGPPASVARPPAPAPPAAPARPTAPMARAAASRGPRLLPAPPPAGTATGIKGKMAQCEENLKRRTPTSNTLNLDSTIR